MSRFRSEKPEATHERTCYRTVTTETVGLTSLLQVVPGGFVYLPSKLKDPTKA